MNAHKRELRRHRDGEVQRTAGPSRRVAEEGDCDAMRDAQGFLRPNELALRLGVSEATLAQWRRAETGPDWCCDADGRTAYAVTRVEDWLARLRAVLEPPKPPRRRAPRSSRPRARRIMERRCARG